MLVPDSFSDRRVCIVGLGYVGLTLAATMADVGFEVLGVEIRDDVVRKLKDGTPHFHEPGLGDKIRRLTNHGRLKVAKYIPSECTATVYIVTVGTPLGDGGRPRLDMVENTSREVAEHLRDGDMVILRSTVRLGTTRQVVAPILAASGSRFDLAFCPERTLEGRAMTELRQLPQLVGGMGFAANVRASQLFQFVTPTVVRVTDPETAEMIKLVDNAQRDVQFAYANEVARLCDAVGISAAEVIRAGKLGYPRTNLPEPGPVGGPCLEKDPYILVDSFKSLHIEPEITLAARRLNQRQPQEVTAYLAGLTRGICDFPDRPVIALLGIAFKGRPPTDDLRGTTARPIFECLKRHYPEAQFRGYDALVSRQEIVEFGLQPAVALEDALDGAHLALILNNHPMFGAMPLPSLAESMARPALVYDFWGNFEIADLEMPAGTGYVALGSHGRAILPRMPR